MKVLHPTVFKEVTYQVLESTIAAIAETTVMCEESVNDYIQYKNAVMEGSYTNPVDLLESVLVNLESQQV